MKTIIKSFVFSFFIVTLIAPTYCYAGENNDFKRKAANSIKAVFKLDNEKDFSLRRIRKTSNFYLYATEPKTRSPIIKIICKKNYKFNITVKNNTNTGKTHIGAISIGHCDSRTELSKNIISKQKDSFALYSPNILKHLKNIKGINKYNSKKVSNNITVQFFTVLAAGHGVLISPTAIISSDEDDYITLLQFELPPNCKSAKSTNLTICTNLEKTFEIMTRFFIEE